MSFVNPLFLIAIAAASIPVIIHLTRDIRAKKVQFSSLMFLRETPKLRVRRRRLTDLLLLLLRSLIFALLAMVFARPFFPQNKVQLILGEESKSVVLLIDNSYSMQYGNLFDLVRNEALNIINKSASHDEFAIVVFNSEIQQLTALSPDKSIHKNALNTQLHKTYATTEFYKPLQLAEEILHEAQNPNRQIVMISDFQSAGFNEQITQWKLDPGITFIPIKIAAEEYTNSFINQFAFRQSRVKTQNAAEYKVQIGSANEKVPENRSVSLWVNDQLIDRKEIRDGDIQQAFFQQLNLLEGSYQGYIQTSDDLLTVDNNHYFTYTVEKLPAILCIEDSPTSSQSNSFFLRSAFDLGDESFYRFNTTPLASLSSKVLTDKHLVFLTNVGSLTNQQIVTLTEYVALGGCLVVSFGDNVNLPQLSSLLSTMGVGIIKNIDKLQNPALQNGIIGQVDLKHPIFSVFIRSGVSEFFRPKFRRYAEIDPDSSVSVLGRFVTGEPFFVSAEYRLGNVLVFASSLNTAWTDFPIYEIYVPFLYQLAAFATSRDDYTREFLVGETVLLEGKPGMSWEISAPQNQTYQVVVDETGFGRFDELLIPGNYYAKSSDKEFRFSVNVDIRESNFTLRNTDEVRAIVTKPTEQKRLALANTTVETDAQGDEKRQKLWRYLLILIIALFAFETYVAHLSLTKKESV